MLSFVSDAVTVMDIKRNINLLSINRPYFKFKVLNEVEDVPNS
jgi:hypothetical protein